MSGVDTLLTFIFVVGLIQLAWFSAMLHLRGISAMTITSTLPPLLAIWILFWPIYTHPAATLASVALMATGFFFVNRMNASWMRTLRSSWSVAPHGLWPLGLFGAGLAIASFWFSLAPAVGFGVALSLCLAISAADMLDRLGRLKTNFPTNPGQTWPGHVLFVAVTALMCAWAMHVYFRTGLSDFLGVASSGAVAAAILRAWAPRMWHPPLIALSLGGMLWIL
ncbi:MAG: hypothetical protein R8K46_05445 [Mariprofundaceae bacterium]